MGFEGSSRKRPGCRVDQRSPILTVLFSGHHWQERHWNLNNTLRTHYDITQNVLHTPHSRHILAEV